MKKSIVVLLVVAALIIGVGSATADDTGAGVPNGNAIEKGDGSSVQTDSSCCCPCCPCCPDRERDRERQRGC